MEMLVLKNILRSKLSEILEQRKSWTDDELKKEALKYQFPGDFQKNSTSAYNSAKRRGKEFYNEITSHMQRKLKSWSEDELRGIALQYKNKSEFSQNNDLAYNAALRKGKEFYDDITKHMSNLHRTWTDDLLKKEALKYNTPTEFQRNDPSAYKLTRDRGQDFFDNATAHMTRQPEWNFDTISKEAKKYSIKSDFRNKSSSAYQAADRLGIMAQVTSHMKPTGNRFKRLIYAYEFPDNSVYIGLTYNLDRRDRSHMKSDTSAVFKYMQATGLKPIKKTLTAYMDKSEASKMEGKLVQQYKNDGWKILNQAKTGALGGDTLKWKPEKIRDLFLQYNDLTKLYDEQGSAILAAKREGMDFYESVTSHISRKITNWTDEMLRDEALKYKTRQDFAQNSPRAYNSAKRKGQEFYDDVTKHMKHQRIQWTDDSLRQEALKYKTKNEFYKKSPSAYKLSRDRGKDFYDSVTAHMDKTRNTWTLDTLKDEMSKYSSLKELKQKSPLAYGNLKYRKLIPLAKEYYNNLNK